MLVQDALLLLAEFVGAFVLSLVLFAHGFEFVLKRFLLRHQILHGLAVLPRHFALLPQAFLHGLHGFAKFRGFSRRLFEVVFDGLGGLVALFTNVVLRRSGDAGGSGPGHFGPMYAVVVPHLKPTLQHVAFAPIDRAHFPSVEERSLTS